MSAGEAAHAEVVRLLQAAEDEAYAWSRLIQRDAERRRRGSGTAADMRDDAEYSDVLDAFVAIGDVLAQVRRLGA